MPERSIPAERGTQMRRRKVMRSGRTVAVLALLALALTGCSAKDWERNLRFGWPTGATEQATKMRVLWTWTGVTALALGVVVWGLIFWACIRYRKKDDELPRQTKYNFVIEAICFTFPFFILAGLFYRTVIVEDDVNHLSAKPDVLVQVDAFKWNWQFEYLTNKVGGSEQNQVYETASGTARTDPNDAKRPFYLSTVGDSNLIPILVVPVHRTVQVIEHSYDVIHSFWVPDFLFKRDVIPYGSNITDRDNRFEFTATTTGSFVGRCAELCGTYHSQMNFEVRVVSDQTYTNYLAALKRIGPSDPDRQAKALRSAMPGKSPYATTTYPLDTDRVSRRASTN